MDGRRADVRPPVPLTVEWSDLRWTLHSILIIAVFAAVILAIALNLCDMVLAAMLGVSALLVCGAFTQPDALGAIRSAGGPLALLFGGMVVARTLEPTGLFERIGTHFLIATRGSGRRFLLGVFALVAVLCAFLPNATTVILLAPIIIRIARALEVDFVGPLVVTAIISNSAGLLTLIGDPATYLVGSSIGMSFTEYLRRVTLGGVLAILVLIPLMPIVLRDVWNVRRTLPADLRPKPLARPVMAACALVVLAGMIVLFMFGEDLPARIVPPGVAIIAASLGLLVIYGARVEPIEQVMKDIDWKTLALSALHVLSGRGVQQDRGHPEPVAHLLRLVRGRAAARGDDGDAGGGVWGRACSPTSRWWPP